MASSPLYLALITGLSFVCFALSATSTFLPVWAYFEETHGGFGLDNGYFSPWKVCKELAYDREKCGTFENTSRFKPSNLVFIAGIMIVLSTFALGIHFILSVIQIVYKKLMRSSLPFLKLLLACIGALTTLLCAGLFALQTDDLRRGFHITQGFSFYLVLVDVILTIILSVMSLYDFKFSQRAGDSTQVPEASGPRAVFLKS